MLKTNLLVIAAAVSLTTAGALADICDLQIEINVDTDHVYLHCLDNGGDPCESFWNIEVGGPEGSFCVTGYGSPGCADDAGIMIPIGGGNDNVGHALAEENYPVAYGWGLPAVKADGSGWAEYGNSETNCYGLVCGDTRDFGQIYCGPDTVTADDFSFTTTPCGTTQIVSGQVLVTPEPTTVGLLLLGGAAGLIRRRR